MLRKSLVILTTAIVLSCGVAGDAFARGGGGGGGHGGGGFGGGIHTGGFGGGFGGGMHTGGFGGGLAGASVGHVAGLGGHIGAVGGARGDQWGHGLHNGRFYGTYGLWGDGCYDLYYPYNNSCID